MGYRNLLDHTVTIFRPGDGVGALRTQVRNYAAIGTAIAAGVRRPGAAMQDIGPGLGTTGSRTIYLMPDVVVAARDVIRLDTGPEAGQRWEVDQPPMNLRGHHIEVRCRHFDGKLPGDT